MAIELADITLDTPVFLAPMAGITDLVYRNLVQSFGAGMVTSEMVASHEMIQAKPGVRERAELGLRVENTAVQLAGREARWMAEAARMVQDRGARMIDINMGCPARKVTNGYSGSALLKDLDHALGLVDAVVGAVDVPVTLKTRLGWDHDTLNATQLAIRAENAGIRMITVHGRTRCQFYSGRANWAAIRTIKSSVSIPVIANGDIVGPDTARQALAASGGDGVMIGRGARGRPWVLAQTAAELAHCTPPPAPTGHDLADIVTRHYQETLSFYGTHLGGRVVRKHLGWYMDHAQTPPGLRRAILTCASPNQTVRLLQSAFCATRALAA